MQKASQEAEVPPQSLREAPEEEHVAGVSCVACKEIRNGRSLGIQGSL